MECFRLPIAYQPPDTLSTLPASLVADLEMLESQTDAASPPLYVTLSAGVPASSPLASAVLATVATRTTTHTPFLRDMQRWLRMKKKIELKKNTRVPIKVHDAPFAAWRERKEAHLAGTFCTQYFFVDWAFASPLNQSAPCLQAIHLYNLASPLLSLLLPIFMLFMPFFILRAANMPVTLEQYWGALYGLLRESVFFKLLTEFEHASWNQRMYLLASVLFYCFSVYSNAMTCVRSYLNSAAIVQQLEDQRDYLATTVLRMETVLAQTAALDSFAGFRADLQRHCDALRARLRNLVQVLEALPTWSVVRALHMGNAMAAFYEMTTCSEYEKEMLYSFGFHGYMDWVEGVRRQVAAGKLRAATFVDARSARRPVCRLVDMVYPAHLASPALYRHCVRNSCRFRKKQRHWVLTGPNASGKTTLLKSVLLNLILSQQLGMGCYRCATLTPFAHFHCYLNIPDTSGRDSLFQAEARRCKEILDKIGSSSTSTSTTNTSSSFHMCIFDELFSGTNPEEAVTSASAFMQYLAQQENVVSLLSTHFVRLCTKLAALAPEHFSNRHMCAETYQVKKGISRVKGGLRVLREMNFPTELLEMVQHV